MGVWGSGMKARAASLPLDTGREGRIKPEVMGRLRRTVKEWSWTGMSRGGVNSSEGHQCWNRLLRNARELRDVHEGYEAFFIPLPPPSPCKG